MRSVFRDSICNFRLIEVVRLKDALIQLGIGLGVLGDWSARDRERLIWTVGFGAVSAAGRVERVACWYASSYL
jgi:hypothetical protein